MAFSFADTMKWIFSDVGLLWCIVEVLITSLVICLMVRNVETWSDKFQAKHRVPLPLVLLITCFSICLCCVIDFLWNLWSIYDAKGGTLDMLSGFAKDLIADKLYVYIVLASAILLISGIYFTCLKAYRVSGIVMLVLSLCIFGGCIYFSQQAMAASLTKRLLPFRKPIVKYTP